MSKGQVVPFRITVNKALEFIRLQASVSSNVKFHPHCAKRMAKRHINAKQVLECLLKGRITEGPYLDLSGDWRVRMERLSAGERVVAVVAIDFIRKTLVVTVF